MRKMENKTTDILVSFLGSCVLCPESFLPIHPFTQEFIRQGRTHSLFYAKRTQFQPTIEDIYATNHPNRGNFTSIFPKKIEKNTQLFFTFPNFFARICGFHTTIYAKQTQFHPQSTNQTRKRTEFHPKLLQLSNRLRRLFLNNCKKIPAFCTFLSLAYLTLYTTKTYIKFYLPKSKIEFIRRRLTHGGAVLPQNTLQERNLPALFLAGKNTKRTQFPKTYVPEGTNLRDMFQSSPDTKNTKRTQFENQESRIENMQNEPNVEAKRMSQIRRRRTHGGQNKPKNLCA